MKAVIMAGGKGTRIAAVNSKIPKPMIPIFHKPILEYQIDCLRKQGFTDITLVVGHLGHVIKNYFGDGSLISAATKMPFGVHITYITEKEPLGTAGALYYLKDILHKDFLLINGDIIFDIQISRFYQFHKEKKGLATLFTHPNQHPYDSGIIVTDENNCVKEWLHKEDTRHWYHNRSNAGLHIISPYILQSLKTLQKIDLDRDVLEPLIAKGLLYAYDSPEYVKDMGTPERLKQVKLDIKTGKVKAKNLFYKQRAIFMDRDGTINQYIGFLKNIDAFALLDGVASAIKKINESGYLAIVVTNQPVIARGEVTIEQLEEIHQKMATLLGQQGAYVDAIYYCPHHPHKGYKGEIPAYKMDCQCRKPKPGMLFEAAKQYHIDLSSSWMVGDNLRDIQAGLAAGCQVAFIGKENMTNVKTFPNLLECVEEILAKGEKQK